MEFMEDGKIVVVICYVLWLLVEVDVVDGC